MARLLGLEAHRFAPFFFAPFSQEYPSLASELERAAIKREAPSALDTSRYALPGPPNGLDASEEEWEAVLRNAAAQLGHQESR